MPEEAPEPTIAAATQPLIVDDPVQPALFNQPMVDKRVIPFESLTSQSERDSIRARAAERPAPVKTGKVQLRHAKSPKRQAREDQSAFQFIGPDEVLPPSPSIICDAPVAPIGMRLQAALWDGLAVAIGCIFLAACMAFVGGGIPSDKKLLVFYVLGLATVPLLYKLLWTFAGSETPGMKKLGLRIIDFDGNPPSHDRRYVRAFGSILSLLAAGMGLVWAFVDEDRLTWQDHMSGTFPTVD